MSAIMPEPRILAGLLGGQLHGQNILCPGPGHSRADRSLSIVFDPQAPEGFRVHSFAGDDWRLCRDYVRGQAGMTLWCSIRQRKHCATFPASKLHTSVDGSLAESNPPPLSATAYTDDDERRRVVYSLRIWCEAVPLPGTLGTRYFKEHRQNKIDHLGDMSHSLRWHNRERMIVALMTDTVTNKPTGVLRTFLNADGSKRERKMLGRQGVIRLSPDDAVITGLGICEGVEDGLALLIGGWHPVWVATSAGAIRKFPVLTGITALTIFADADTAGIKAATVCAERWNNSGNDAVIVHPCGGNHA